MKLQQLTFHKFLLSLSLLCAAALVACGGGGGGGGIGSGPTIRLNDYEVKLGALNEVVPSVASRFISVEAASNPEVSFQFSDDEVTNVTVEPQLSSGTNWDFDITRVTSSSTLTVMAAVDTAAEDAEDYVQSLTISHGGADGISQLFFLSTTLEGEGDPVENTDWLYAGFWVHKPEPATVDDIHLIAFAGSKSPFPASDLGALTVIARYGSRGAANGDTDDGDVPEVIGFYSGQDGTSVPFSADLLLEADFDQQMLGLVRGVIYLDDLIGSQSILHLERAIIHEAVTEGPIGEFSGVAEGEGGPIDGWLGSYDGKFHFKSSDVLDRVLDDANNAPYAVLGTFGANDPSANTQNIIGLIVARINEACTFDRFCAAIPDPRSP